MTKPASKDLAAFDALTKAQEDGLSVDILDPTGESTGITITVAGPDSARYKSAEQIDKRLKRRSAAPMTASEIAQASLEGLADCVIAWSPVTLDGADLPMTSDNAVRLFTRFPWIREQVNAAAGDRTSFLESLSSDSATAS
jgi:hypothetical protein